MGPMTRECRPQWGRGLLACVMLVVANARLAGMPQQGVAAPVDPRPATSQGPGDLRGSVKDEVGEAMFGASVILTDAHQRTRRTTTDLTGVYVFHDVPPGAYQLEVSRAGFAPVSR